MTPVKHILICDDDPFLTEMYALSLTKPHVHIAIVHNGKDAIAAVEKQTPDIMLLDLLMPVMDGFHFLEERAKRGWTFPVIVLSNVSQEEDTKRCLENGATDFFPKSETDLEKLQKKVEMYVGKGE